MSPLSFAALRGGQVLRLRVHGDSMRPLLRPGDRVEVSAIAPFAARPGDVVVAVRGGSLVCHRLVAYEGNLARTKGDAWPGVDPPLLAHHVCGRVIAVMRAGRRVDLLRQGWPLAGRCLAHLAACPRPARRLASRLLVHLWLAFSQEG